jgi:hypothetical protein
VKRSYPEGIRLLLCISTERATLADSINRLEPPNENHRKVKQRERTFREGHEDLAGSVKTFRKPAMLKTTPLACERKAT